MARKYIDAIEGRFWNNKKRARYKSGFIDNRLNNSRQADLALLTDTKPTIDIASKIPAYSDAAQIVQKVIQAEWLKNNMAGGLALVGDIAEIQGTGFWKIGAALPGIMQVLPCGPESVMPIQPQFDIQQSTGVLYETWKSLTYFRNKFPYSYASIENEVNWMDQGSAGDGRFNRPSEVPEYVWNGLAPQIKRVVGVKTGISTGGMDLSPFRSLRMQEFWMDDQSINESRRPVLMKHPHLTLEQHNWWYWVKPGERLYPRKRLIVFAGRKCVYDGPSPFWHGLFPFACLRLNPVPHSFWGLSKYRDLLPVNQALNEIGAGIMDMIARALNPVAITKASAVAANTWNDFYPDLPGAKLFMLPNGNPTSDLRYMDPPNIPAWVVQFHQYLAGEFDRLSGTLDTLGIAKKKQVPGGDTIEQMKDSLGSIMRLKERYLETFLSQAGIQAVSNVFQYYTLPIRLRMLGADGVSMEDAEINAPNLVPDNVPKEDHWKNFAMTILPGSLHGGAKDRNKQVAISLAQHGMIPLQYLYEQMELPNPAQLFQMLTQEREAGMTPGGKGPRMTRGQRNGKAA